MDRDPVFERYLLDLAAQAAGHSMPDPDRPGKSKGHDLGLRAFADYRTEHGPVRLPRDFDQEAREEIADCVNYLTWAVQRSYDRVIAGDADALDSYHRRMQALAALVAAWHGLHS